MRAVENLILEGTGNINGTGNNLNNPITGNSGNNRITGSDGNDTYYMDNTSDRTIENGNQGIDTVDNIRDFNNNFKEKVK